MKPEVANRRIESFSKRFGEAHLIFAYHAAFPLALTPDLLYKLWANFQRDIHGRVLGIPWVAVADLLLSSLCEEVGHELYEMDAAMRNLLLSRLKEDVNFGQQRINELSDFLLAYVQQQLNSVDPDVRDFAQAQRWTALAYVRPDLAAQELALALKDIYGQDKTEVVRIASLLETFAEPLATFKPLLIYANSIKNIFSGQQKGADSEFNQLFGQENQLQNIGIELNKPSQELSIEQGLTMQYDINESKNKFFYKRYRRFFITREGGEIIRRKMAEKNYTWESLSSEIDLSYVKFNIRSSIKRQGTIPKSSIERIAQLLELDPTDIVPAQQWNPPPSQLATYLYQRFLKSKTLNGNSGALLVSDCDNLSTAADIINKFRGCNNPNEAVELFECLATRIEPPIGALADLLKNIKLESVLALTIQTFSKIKNSELKARLKESDDLIAMLSYQTQSGSSDLIRWSAARTIEIIGFDFLLIAQYFTDEPHKTAERIIRSKISKLKEIGILDSDSNEELVNFWNYLFFDLLAEQEQKELQDILEKAINESELI